MNEHDFDPGLEATLRAGLQRGVPPAAPEHVRDGVVRLARHHLDEAAHRRSLPAWRRAFAREASPLRRGIGGLAAVAACVVLIIVALDWRPAGGTGSGGETPTPTAHQSEAAASHGPWTENDGHSSGVVSLGGWVSPHSAWVVVSNDSGYFLRFTSDGGHTWSEARKLPGTTESAEFVDPLHGWAAGLQGSGSVRRAVVYRTVDGGATWRTGYLGGVQGDVPGEPVVIDVHFTDASHGRVLTARSLVNAGVPPGGAAYADCRLLVTADGGASWSDPTFTACGEVRVFTWADALRGYSLRGPNQVTVTDDGAASWRSATLPDVPAGFVFQPQLFEVVGAGNYRIAGTYMPTTQAAEPLPFVVYETTDNGVSWRETSRVADVSSIQTVTSAGPDVWYSLREDAATVPHLSTLLVSTDAGRTWRPRTIETVHAGAATYTPEGNSGLRGAQLSFADAHHGLLQGVYMDCRDRSKSCGATGTVFVTDDGGRTWHQVPF